MVTVGRNSGDNSRFVVYPVTTEGLGAGISGGTGFKDALGVTGLAFGAINGEGVLMVSVGVGGQSDQARIYVYKLDDGALVQLARNGSNWGNGRDATCIASGLVQGRQLVGYGRSAWDNTKGGVLRWM